jgi:hypothetical protein
MEVLEVLETKRNDAENIPEKSFLFTTIFTTLVLCGSWVLVKNGLWTFTITIIAAIGSSWAADKTYK